MSVTCPHWQFLISDSFCRYFALFGRHEDFSQGTLDECYVVHNSKAVVIKAGAFAAPDKETIKQIINDVIEKLRT